eukprot:5260570-Amphidinium_carterae.1
MGMVPLKPSRWAVAVRGFQCPCACLRSAWPSPQTFVRACVRACVRGCVCKLHVDPGGVLATADAADDEALSIWKNVTAHVSVVSKNMSNIININAHYRSQTNVFARQRSRYDHVAA